jgi:hypothetical protein
MQLIKSTQPNPAGKGHAFTVSFTKKDGTFRTMRARLGMRRGLKGKGFAYNPATRGLLPVWELGKGYKMVNLERVSDLSIRHPVTHRRTNYVVAGENVWPA